VQQDDGSQQKACHSSGGPTVSRRRYISTDISVDKRINTLSDFGALLYTWMIPHADDAGSITSDCEELAWIVVPGRQRKTPQIAAALQTMLQQELLVRGVDNRLYFPQESFYRYQTYIPPAKRRLCDPAVEQRRETPQNTASPSPSPSPIKHMSSAVQDFFNRFWEAYPRKEGKGAARTAYEKAYKKVGPDDILCGLMYQVPDMRRKERQYIPMPATWLNQERWDDSFGGPDLDARSKRIANARAQYQSGYVDAARAMVNDDEWEEVIA
jgi:hypothetical protein